MEDIDKIFAIRPKSQRNKTQDVIYTLSSAVQQIEEHTSNQDQQAQQHDQSISQRADLIKALTQQNNTATGVSDPNNTQHLDGQPQTGLRVPGGVKIAIQALARQFRPFHAPPVPTPAPDVEFFEPRTKPQTETTKTSTLPPLEFELRTEPELPTKETTASPAPKEANNFFTPTFTSQRRSRRGLLLAKHLEQMIEIRRIGQVKRMDLISVKRIRRLKMKKHKFKKLQRKTRNLRRRQGKI